MNERKQNRGCSLFDWSMHNNRRDRDSYFFECCFFLQLETLKSMIGMI
ncbi:hypothetical protein MtrunA17_Chr5g0422821 [Medicago truncatula]|uniref:Uncharacterized protein n=1 Tax=Medicago truncatula TaxID=3880 RepID=A0A396HTM5_MEDTR|nr:hypothetical protein MtrunA17_Chr5g0422821 [Medicago truncatula]